VPAGLLAVLFLATVPESLRNSEIPALLPTTGRQAAQRGVRAARRTVRDLLSRRWIAATLTLWFMCAINNVMLFLLVGWLPSMLTSVGWDIGDASRAAAAVQIGGICGGLLLTWLFDLSVSSRALAAAYCLLMVLLLVLNLVPPVVLTWSIIMGLVGGCVIGGFYALCAVAATIYPSEIRATAIGWTGAMSRVGSISGSLVGGLLLYLGLGTTRTFALLAVPAALCAGLALYLQRIRQREAVSSVDRG
jgi:AAHS family 4-hydroxybenzoate transporter-like MFS transporter